MQIDIMAGLGVPGLLSCSSRGSGPGDGPDSQRHQRKREGTTSFSYHASWTFHCEALGFFAGWGERWCFLWNFRNFDAFNYCICRWLNQSRGFLLKLSSLPQLFLFLQTMFDWTGLERQNLCMWCFARFQEIADLVSSKHQNWCWDLSSVDLGSPQPFCWLQIHFELMAG